MNTHIMQYSFHILPATALANKKEGEQNPLGFTPPLLKV